MHTYNNVASYAMTLKSYSRENYFVKYRHIKKALS